MSGINYPSVAKLRQEGVHEWQLFEGSTDATNLAAILDAQVEATLALVYEQRTANLIALYADSEVTTSSGVTLGFSDSVLAELQVQIATRLDLTESL